MKKLLIICIAIFLFSCEEIEQEKKIKFTILQLNDVYEIGTLSGGKFGGLSRVATLRKKLLAENPNTITLLAGDFLNPSLIGNMKYDGKRIKGKQMIEVLNELQLDYVTFGNHEIDLKEAQLLERINESNFDWIATNTFHNVNGKPQAFQRNGKDLPTYVIREIKSEDGKTTLKIGFIGVTLDFNKKPYVHYDDVYQSAKTTYEAIKDKCDVVIAITHLTIDQDKELAKRVPQIPFLLGGHDHSNMKHQIGNVLIAKADANAKTAYVHRISYDFKTKKCTITPTLVNIDTTIVKDKKVEEIVQKWEYIASESMNSMGFDPNNVVAEIDSTWEARESHIRYEQTNLGKIITKSMLKAFPKADVALLNSGSVRIDDVLTGTITQTDVMRILPYGGANVLATIKGNVLEKILTIGTEKNIGRGGYLQVANAFKDPKKMWLINGKSLKKNKNYKVVIPKFVMQGKEANLEFIKNEKYTLPEKVGKNKNIENDVRNILIDYLKSR